MSISAAYVTIGSYISRVSTNYIFATVYKGRHTKEMSVIDEPACCSQVVITWDEFHHNTEPNNFECLHKVQYFKSSF